MNLAKVLLDAAAAAEVKVTPLLMQLAVEAEGCLAGLDFRFKGMASLAAKLERKALEKGMTQEEYAGNVTDVLRYTFCGSADTLVSQYAWFVRGLAMAGYCLFECTNTFGKAGLPYWGINCLVAAPDGYVFELQFHTEESLAAKERIHVLYEQARDPKCDPDHAVQLQREMIAITSAITLPADVDLIESFS